MAGTRKNQADDWMPPRVYRGRSAYELKTRQGKTIRLCDLTCTNSQVWAEYERFIADHILALTFADLAGEYLNSMAFNDLATDTQKKYRAWMARIIRVFGDMQPDRILPQHIRKYMDKRGETARVQANREKALMSNVFKWGYERGKNQANPCAGVSNFSEQSRNRYITDEEYTAVYSEAPDVIRAAMEIAYLCMARKKDILNLRYTQLLETGIIIRQSKNSVAQIKAWTPRLRAAIALAESVPVTGIKPLYVIHKKSGNKYTENGLNYLWRRVKQRCEKRYPHLSFDFTFHDLKAKGISDLDGTLQEKQAIAGHKNIRSTAIYDRRIPIVPVVGGQDQKENGNARGNA